jgi:hypothetical protein
MRASLRAPVPDVYQGVTKTRIIEVITVIDRHSVDLVDAVFALLDDEHANWFSKAGAAGIKFCEAAAGVKFCEAAAGVRSTKAPGSTLTRSWLTRSEFARDSGCVSPIASVLIVVLEVESLLRILRR